MSTERWVDALGERDGVAGSRSMHLGRESCGSRGGNSSCRSRE